MNKRQVLTYKAMFEMLATLKRPSFKCTGPAHAKESRYEHGQYNNTRFRNDEQYKRLRIYTEIHKLQRKLPNGSQELLGPDVVTVSMRSNLNVDVPQLVGITR